MSGAAGRAEHRPGSPVPHTSAPSHRAGPTEATSLVTLLPGPAHKIGCRQVAIAWTASRKGRSDLLMQGSCCSGKHRPLPPRGFHMQIASACTDAELLDAGCTLPAAVVGVGGVRAALVSTLATSSLVGSWAFRCLVLDRAALPFRTDTT